MSTHVKSFFALSLDVLKSQVFSCTCGSPGLNTNDFRSHNAKFIPRKDHLPTVSPASYFKKIRVPFSDEIRTYSKPVIQLFMKENRFPCTSRPGV